MNIVCFILKKNVTLVLSGKVRRISSYTGAAA